MIQPKITAPQSVSESALLAATLPSSPGSYALWLTLGNPARLHIGKLGTFYFPAGVYLYLGSAHGSGGLRGRMLHHGRPVVRPHWHIDWLRGPALLASGWYAESPSALECAWSQALARLPEARTPAPGFGAADCACGCSAHLLYLPFGVECDLVAAILRDTLSKIAPNKMVMSELRS